MKIFKFLVLFLLSILLFGCSSLEYTGEDYKTENLQTIKTNEDFVVKTYKKTLGNTNVRIGVFKTPVTEILALYVQIENLSYDTPYTFRVEDLRLSDSDGEIKFITTNNYLNIYQTQEAATMTSMAYMGTTLSNMAGMITNYNEVNQSMLQNTAQSSNQDAYAKLEELGTKILNHSVKNTATISPRKSQYYYFFFQDREKSPINVRYKTLNYQFNS